MKVTPEHYSAIQDAINEMLKINNIRAMIDSQRSNIAQNELIKDKERSLVMGTYFTLASLSGKEDNTLTPLRDAMKDYTDNHIITAVRKAMKSAGIHHTF